MGVGAAVCACAGRSCRAPESDQRMIKRRSTRGAGEGRPSERGTLSLRSTPTKAHGRSSYGVLEEAPRTRGPPRPLGSLHAGEREIHPQGRAHRAVTFERRFFPCLYPPPHHERPPLPALPPPHRPQGAGRRQCGGPGCVPGCDPVDGKGKERDGGKTNAQGKRGRARERRPKDEHEKGERAASRAHLAPACLTA